MELNDEAFGGFMISKNVFAGRPIGYSYRERSEIPALNGWTVYSVDDDDGYVSDPANFTIPNATIDRGEEADSDFCECVKAVGAKKDGWREMSKLRDLKRWLNTPVEPEHCARAIFAENVVGEFTIPSSLSPSGESYLVYVAPGGRIRVNASYTRYGDLFIMHPSYGGSLCDSLTEYEKLDRGYIDRCAYNCWMSGAR